MIVSLLAGLVATLVVSAIALSVRTELEQAQIRLEICAGGAVLSLVLLSGLVSFTSRLLVASTSGVSAEFSLAIIAVCAVVLALGASGAAAGSVLCLLTELHQSASAQGTWCWCHRLYRGAGAPPNALAFVLGQTVRKAWWKRVRPVSVTEAEYSMHSMVVGGSGTGKSHAIKVMLGFLGGPGILVDLKADPELTSFVKARYPGSKVFELGGALTWNPLRRGTPDELTDKVLALFDWSETFWREVAGHYLQEIFNTLGLLGETATLAGVIDLLRPDGLRTAARRVGDPAQLTHVNQYLATLDRTALSGVSGLQHRLARLVHSDTGRSIAGVGELDLLEAIEKGQVVHFSIDGNKYGRMAELIGGALLIELKTIASELQKRRFRESGGRCWIVVDEMQRLGEATGNVSALLEMARSAGLPCTLATQSLANFSRQSPTLLSTVLDSTNVKLIFRQADPESAELLARLMGTETTTKKTHQIMDGATTGAGSIREVEAYRVHPNAIKSAGLGRAFLVVGQPFRVSEVAIAA